MTFKVKVVFQKGIEKISKYGYKRTYNLNILNKFILALCRQYWYILSIFSISGMAGNTALLSIFSKSGMAGNTALLSAMQQSFAYQAQALAAQIEAGKIIE